MKSRVLPLLLATVVSGQAQSPIKVLFMGGQDNGGVPHLPRNLRDTLAPVFIANNMVMSFREATTHSWLHPDSLAQYDVMLAYTANRGSGFSGGTNLTAAQLTALTQWLESGRVNVVFHGSSNTYQNSSNNAWRQLLGAQFQDHGPLSGTGNAGAITFTQPFHPTLLGTTSLPTSATASGGSPYWDEGRRHQNFSSDTIVLARSQLNASVNVPWIWVRPQGQGWVYYNASGHDGETWRRAEWKLQVIRALEWGHHVKTTGIRGKAAVEQLIRIQGGELFVPVRGAYSLRITDMQGREVFFRPRSAAASQNVSSLPAGTYGVRILSETREAIQSLFIKKR
jgi:type 1 glutamine amidotransferase